MPTDLPTGKNLGLAENRSQRSFLGNSWQAKHLLEHKCGSGNLYALELCQIWGYGSDPARQWRGLVYCPACRAPPAKSAHRCYTRFQLRIQAESSQQRAWQSNARVSRCRLCDPFSRRNPEIWIWYQRWEKHQTAATCQFYWYAHKDIYLNIFRSLSSPLYIVYLCAFFHLNSNAQELSK